jgi:hypothetical protein
VVSACSALIGQSCPLSRPIHVFEYGVHSTMSCSIPALAAIFAAAQHKKRHGSIVRESETRGKGDIPLMKKHERVPEHQHTVISTCTKTVSHRVECA